jgi:hypothetical protein
VKQDIFFLGVSNRTWSDTNDDLSDLDHAIRYEQLQRKECVIEENPLARI